MYNLAKVMKFDKIKTCPTLLPLHAIVNLCIFCQFRSESCYRDKVMLIMQTLISWKKQYSAIHIVNSAYLCFSGRNFKVNLSSWTISGKFLANNCLKHRQGCEPRKITLPVRVQGKKKMKTIASSYIYLREPAHSYLL